MSADDAGGPAETDSFALDLLTGSAGLRRGVPVRLAPDGLRVGERRIADEHVFWTARRSGLFMVFAKEETLALRGEPEVLDALSRGYASRVDPEEQRRRLLEPLSGEVVVFAGACAAAGRLGGEPVRGLHVAVCTRSGLHLVSGQSRRTFPFPADGAEVEEGESGPGRESLRLWREDADLRLFYLFPEEREAALRAARRRPASRDGSLELFSRREVAPPPPAEVPELSAAAGSLQPAARRESERVPDAGHERLRPHFFEMHFLELGEIALGPLLLRKSAASGAGSLERAVEALDAGELQQDTRAAVARAVDRLATVYTQELDRLLEEKRSPARLRNELTLTEEERAELSARVQAPFDRLAPRFRDLEEEQKRLADRLDAVGSGPPGEGDERLEEPARDWKSALSRLDRGYEKAWGEAIEEMRRTWTSTLLPRLGQVEELPGRRMPEWVQLAIIALLALAAAAAVAFLLAG